MRLIHWQDTLACVAMALSRSVPLLALQKRFYGCALGNLGRGWALESAFTVALLGSQLGTYYFSMCTRFHGCALNGDYDVLYVYRDLSEIDDTL